MIAAEEKVTIQSGGLALEGSLSLPEGTGRRPAVVLCHPHPRFGGDMHNPVVSSIARGLSDASMAALRFNFRGVGQSQGAFDGGVAEIDDAVAALEYLALHDKIDGSSVGIAGYSFGAAIALAVAAREGLAQAVASIACPVSAFTAIGAQEMVLPKLLVLGELDHDFPADQFKFLAKRFQEPKEVELVDGADHFFAGHGDLLAERTAEFFGRWLG